jgi:hypothetical protein
MGVEYKHYLIPADPDFVPAKQAIIHVYRLMEKWALLSGAPKIFDLTKGINTTLEDSLDSLEVGQGLAIEYPEVQGEAVRKIMGESYYTDDEITDGDRYIERFTFILGLDYRIHPGSEELSVTVINPPEENGVPIEPYCEEDEFLHYGIHAQAYHSSLTTRPPEVEISAADDERIIGEQPFSGYWRTAFVIDCGKDLPKLGNTLYKIENRDFVKELEAAIGTALIEVGEVG